MLFMTRALFPFGVSWDKQEPFLKKWQTDCVSTVAIVSDLCLTASNRFLETEKTLRIIWEYTKALSLVLKFFRLVHDLLEIR